MYVVILVATVIVQYGKDRFAHIIRRSVLSG